MARDFNQTRFATAILKAKAGINSPGVYYALNDGADGYSVVEVSSLPTVELFIGQGTSAQAAITEWTLFNSQKNYGGIGSNAFAHFTNLESITIWQNSGDDVLAIDDNAFTTNSALEKIYVNPTLLSEYQTTYAGKSFVSLFASYLLVDEWEIPTIFNGEYAPTTLDNAWILKCCSGMPVVMRNAKTKIVVPNYFTSISAGSFASLEEIFVNLDIIMCEGQKTLASGFLNGAGWCKHVWLDNGSCTLVSPYCTDDTEIYSSFRIVAPYNQFQAYFMQEHNIKTGIACPIIGYSYFAGSAEMPVDSETGVYLWFSNIDFDTDYSSPTGLENDPSYISDYETGASGYYYCYDKTTTLVIQGSGTMTSALVQNTINGLNTPLTWINKIIIPTSFNTLDVGCLDIINNYNDLSDLTLETALINLNKNIYTNFTSSNTKITRVRLTYTGSMIYTAQFNLENIYTKELFISASSWTKQYAFTAIKKLNNEGIILTAPNCSTFSGFRMFYSEDKAYAKMYLPKITTLSGLYCLFKDTFIETGAKFFVGTDNLGDVEIGAGNWNNKTRYFPATALNYYLSLQYLGAYPLFVIGVIDGNDVYADKGFTYPKLTGVDTESNIQALTPTGDALYLASDTGNLWQYSNGSWTNLFSGYTPTWYSNEDCTTTILPSGITTSDTVYVKLA